MVRGYDLFKPGGHLGNVGSSVLIPDAEVSACATQRLTYLLAYDRFRHGAAHLDMVDMHPIRR